MHILAIFLCMCETIVTFTARKILYSPKKKRLDRAYAVSLGQLLYWLWLWHIAFLSVYSIRVDEQDEQDYIENIATFKTEIAHISIMLSLHIYCKQ